MSLTSNSSKLSNSERGVVGTPEFITKMGINVSGLGIPREMETTPFNL